MKVLLYALASVLILSALFLAGCRTTEEADAVAPDVKVYVPTVEIAVDAPDINQPNPDVDLATVEVHGSHAAPAGPQGPVGPQGRIAPDVASLGAQGSVGPQGRAGPGVGHVVIFGIDWIYFVSSALVLVALGAGLAIGRGTRSQLLGH
jgi:hypothetical protein